MDSPNKEHLMKSALEKLSFKRAMCKVPPAQTDANVDYAMTVGTVRRANVDRLREVFVKYATHEENGEPYMSSEDFVRNYLGMFPEPNFNKESVKLIASAADTTKDGYISFDEFQVNVLHFYSTLLYNLNCFCISGWIFIFVGVRNDFMQSGRPLPNRFRDVRYKRIRVDFLRRIRTYYSFNPTCDRSRFQFRFGIYKTLFRKR